MTTAVTSGRRIHGRLLKSPLAMPGDSAVSAAAADTATAAPALESVVLSDRGAMLAEFEDYLRTVSNRDGRPYEEKTIINYVGPGKNLDAWMTASGIDGDFTDLDTETLNRYFREYYLEHGQGGTHTLQRNLIQLFDFLEHERGHPSPYPDGLNRPPDRDGSGGPLLSASAGPAVGYRRSGPPADRPARPYRHHGVADQGDRPLALPRDAGIRGTAYGANIWRLDPGTGAILAHVQQPVLDGPANDANFDGFQILPDKQGTILLKTQNRPTGCTEYGNYAAGSGGCPGAPGANPHPFVLAVDEAHQLSNTEGTEILKTLAEDLPAGSRLAVAGRREPRLELTRLRSERRVLDIGIGDLRIDVPEARELLAAAGARLSEPEVAALVSRTEGWPVGLYFAALAGNAHAFPRCHQSTFDGDDHLLADYIRSEFLAHLPPDRQRFLARSSVLDELSGPLCDATLDRTGSAAALEEMEESNLLLIPLDRQHRWYRFHRLFQRMLRRELERREPAAIPVLARRASQWCEANGLLDSAIGYAQLAGESSRVSHLLERTAMRQYALGRATTLRRWFGWLAGHGPAGGGAAVLGAWLSLLSGRAADAERWAVIATDAPQDTRTPDGSPLQAWVLTLHAAMARDVRQMRRDAAGGLRTLSPGSQWRPTAATILGTTELLLGNLDAADQHLAETVELAADLDGPAAASVALATRAIIAIRRDRWPQARTLAERASSVIQQAHLQDYATSALAYAVRSRVTAHDGDPWMARDQIAAAGQALPLLGRPLAHLAAGTRLELVRAHLALGDVPAAKDLLSEADQLLRGDCDFGSLNDDARELSVTVEQIQAASASGPKLTPAELRLLPLLATQLSFREIAEQLYLSVHTVKAQVTSIYRKLSVSSRTQAIERSRSLGLLPA